MPAVTATSVCVNPTLKDHSVESAREDITTFLFVKSAYVPLVVMDHVMSWADVSVMQVTREASATAVQMATMAFPTARPATATPWVRTAHSATIPLASVRAGPTYEEAIATAVQRVWWAFPRVLNVTAIQMARGFYLE